MRDDLKLTCSDDGQHPACEIAKIVWQPSIVEEGKIYELGEGRSDYETVPMGGSSRSTALGRDRHVSRSDVIVTVRASGGRTFQFPRCGRCGKTPPPLRDDTVSKLREWDSESFDLSLLRK